MVITQKFIYKYHLNRKEAPYAGFAKSVQSSPMAWFGACCTYPKMGRIIKEWTERKPIITVVTGWKRTGKTQIGAYLGSCFLLGEINKTWPGAHEMGLSPLIWNPRVSGHRVGLIGGRTMEHIDSILLALYRETLPPKHITGWFSSGATHKKIEIIGKHKMVIRSYDQSVEIWKSGNYQFIHLDEEPPLPHLLECLERRRLVNGQILITVALDDADASYLPEACLYPKKYFGIEPEQFMHAQLGVEDVPDDIYPEPEKKIVYNQYDGTPLEKAVRFGEFVYLAGKWWAGFDPKIHVIAPFPIPATWKKWRAVDAGFAAPTACVWAALHPSGFVVVWREYYQTGKTIDERCKDIIAASGNERRKEDGYFREVEKKEKYEMTLLDHAEFRKDDHTGDGLDFEYVKSGLEVQPWTTLGQEARRDIMHRWLYVDKKEKHFITHEPGAPRIYFFSDCINLIWEAQRKCFKRSKTTTHGTIEKKVQNSDDHLLDGVEAVCAELSWMVQDREIV